MYRDFSEKSKQELLNIIDTVESEKITNFTDWVGDRWLDIESWLGFLQIGKYVNNVSAYHKKVIDKNNTSKEKINDIFARVHAVDARYKNKLVSISNQMNALVRYINGLEMVMNPTDCNFSADSIEVSVGKIWEETSLLIKKMYDISDVYLKPIIDGFDPTQDLFFANHKKWIDQLSIGYASDWMDNITSFVGITDNVNEVHMRKSIESYIKSLLVNKHEVSDFYDEFTKAYTLDDWETGTKILGVIANAADEYITKEQLDPILKIGVRDRDQEAYVEFLLENQKLTQEVKKNLEVANSLADATEIIDIANKILSKAFNDYSEDVKYLEAIRTALNDGGYDNKTVNDVVDTMILEYKNQYSYAAYDAAKMVADKYMDNAVGELLPWVDICLNAKDITASICGLDDEANDTAAVYASQHYSYAIVDKYDYYRKRILSGEYTETDMEQCKLYFEMATKVKIKEYEAIIKTAENSLNSVSASLFSNSEVKQATRDAIARIQKEIRRLESLRLPF